MPEKKTITLIVKDDYTGLTTKIVKQCSSHEDITEVMEILREMLLALGYQPGTLAEYFGEIRPCARR